MKSSFDDSRFASEFHPENADLFPARDDSLAITGYSRIKQLKKDLRRHGDVEEETAP